MANKNSAKVIIGGKVITLGGYECEEYFQKVASYMNRKIAQLSDLPGYSRQPVDMKNLLLSLNITDDYFKAKKQAEVFELDFHKQEQEMYDLKHELVSLQMREEDAQSKLHAAKSQNADLERKIKELEKQIDELLK